MRVPTAGLIKNKTLKSNQIVNSSIFLTEHSSCNEHIIKDESKTLQKNKKYYRTTLYKPDTDGFTNFKYYSEFPRSYEMFNKLILERLPL